MMSLCLAQPCTQNWLVIMRNVARSFAAWENTGDCPLKYVTCPPSLQTASTSVIGVRSAGNSGGCSCVTSRRRLWVLTLHRSLITRPTSGCRPSEDRCLFPERASRFFATRIGWRSSRRSRDIPPGTHESDLWLIELLLSNCLWGFFHCR